ncbi:hypothetical protein MMC26_000959 [Xylographa opegraphella]|nr:hypothetical protein [Xylographa opegraphella]
MAALSSQLQGLLSDKAGAASFIAGTVSTNGRLNYLATAGPLSGGSLLSYFIYSTLLIPIVVPIYRLIQKDYNAFLALGPGGTPSTFNGYLWVTFLRLVFARSDIYTAPQLTPYEHPAQGYLQDIPQRIGERPKVAGIAPHRQVTQKGSKVMLAALTAAIYEIKAANPLLLATGVSCFEQHNLALFFSPHSAEIQTSPTTSLKLLPPPAVNPRAVRTNSLQNLNSYSAACEHPAEDNAAVVSKFNTCDHPAEIVHLHTTEASMHLTLHPSDAALVISRGWGERHPLAGRGPWVPKGFMMVYAPRTMEELDVLRCIIRASGWWVGGCLLRDLPNSGVQDKTNSMGLNQAIT